MTDRLVTIANFAYGADPVTEAELVRIKLEFEGIECFWAGRNSISILSLYLGISRGVELQVKESDAAQALEILKRKEGTVPENNEDDLIKELISDQCPKCHSNNIEYERFSRNFFCLSILFLRFPIPFLKKS
jgi:hypothetical protein